MYEGGVDAEKVSAIVITHNRLNMVEKAINSVLKQTYTNIELLVVDDASDIETKEQLTAKAAAEGFTYIYIPMEESLGGNHARNIGIRNSNGRYIALLDDDDEWLPEKIEKQVKFLTEHPDYGVVSCLTIREYDMKDRVKEPINKRIEGDIHALIFTHIYCLTSSLMISRDVLDKCGIFDENIGFWQEYELSIRFAQVTKAGVLPEYLMLYRIAQNDKSRLTNNLDGWIAAVEYIENKHKRLIEQLPSAYYKKHQNLIANDGFSRALNVGNRKMIKYYFFRTLKYGPSIQCLIKLILGRNGIQTIHKFRGYFIRFFRDRSSI